MESLRQEVEGIAHKHCILAGKVFSMGVWFNNSGTAIHVCYNWTVDSVGGKW